MYSEIVGIGMINKGNSPSWRSQNGKIYAVYGFAKYSAKYTMDYAECLCMANVLLLTT